MKVGDYRMTENGDESSSQHPQDAGRSPESPIKWRHGP